MIFVKDGQRIATENFVSGKVYNILFVTGINTNMMCTSIGADCVVFQGQAPLNLFTLTMQNADIVDTIEESSGSTESYNDLTNKPQINNVTLTGNKSLSDLGIAAAASFAVGSSDNGKVLTAIYEEGQGSFAWVTPSGGGGTTATTYSLSKSVPSDAVFTDTTYESKSAASGGTALSLCTTGEKYTWNNKQSALSSSQLTAVNSGVTSTTVSQVATNTSNISTLTLHGSKTNDVDNVSVSEFAMYESTAPNLPTNAYTIVRTSIYSATAALQEAFITSTGDAFIRTKASGVWNEWKKITP